MRRVSAAGARPIGRAGGVFIATLGLVGACLARFFVGGLASKKAFEENDVRRSFDVPARFPPATPLTRCRTLYSSQCLCPTPSLKIAPSVLVHDAVKLYAVEPCSFCFFFGSVVSFCLLAFLSVFFLRSFLFLRIVNLNDSESYGGFIEIHRRSSGMSFPRYSSLFLSVGRCLYSGLIRLR